VWDLAPSKQYLDGREQLQNDPKCKTCFNNLILMETEIKSNPYYRNPKNDRFEKLKGFPDNMHIYSRRLNTVHRFVYRIFDKDKKIELISCWGHYE
jgi:Txe/YoeB family toxin of toxin-antitoxin system